MVIIIVCVILRLSYMKYVGEGEFISNEEYLRYTAKARHLH